MDELPLVLSCTPTFAENVALADARRGCGPGNLASFVFLYWLLPAASVFSLTLPLYTRGLRMGLAALAAFLAASVLSRIAIVQQVYLRFRRRRLAHRAKRLGWFASSQPAHWIIDGDGITRVMGRGISFLDWNLLQHVRLTRDGLWIGTRPYRGFTPILIPASALSGRADSVAARCLKEMAGTARPIGPILADYHTGRRNFRRVVGAWAIAAFWCCWAVALYLAALAVSGLFTMLPITRAHHFPH